MQKSSVDSASLLPRLAKCSNNDVFFACLYLESLNTILMWFTSLLTHDGIPSMAVKLTERAAQEVRRFQKEHNFEDSMVLRIGVAGGGCSGFNYTLNFDDSFDVKADSKYDCHGVAVVVDKKSALYLDGTTVDWHESLEKQGFTFENPNAVKSCGCGSSFQA